MVWTIPVDKIQFGIEETQHTARYFHDLAKGHLKQMDDELQKGGTSMRTIHAVIFLYYGLEELGKLMILFEKLDEAKRNGDSQIVLDKYVGDHNIKLNKAKQAYPDLVIQKREPENGWKNDGSFEDLVPKGDILTDFMERSNSWLATWYPDRSTWQEPDGWIERDDVQTAIGRFGAVLDEWFEKIKEMKNQ